MTVHSMTGFARVEKRNAQGCVTCEIRTVNQRYLETNFRLPEWLRASEADLRGIIQQHLTRGKCDITFNVQVENDQAVALKINQPILHAVLAGVDELKKDIPEMQVNAMRVLSWPGVAQLQNMATPELIQASKEALQEALQVLVQSRQREGASIVEFISERIQVMLQEVAAVKAKFPEVLASEQEQIKNRFAELQLELNAERLEHELVWYAQKVDIAEELQRLEAHLSEFKHLLEQGGVIGRRLDFLAQELNREANTLASKACHVQISHAAVELKVAIEQIREQVQNIE